jgi:Spy/CpxP family protein refolding chaperone
VCPLSAQAQGDVNGVIELVSGALAKTCISDDQRAAVEKLGKTVATKEHEVRDARRALLFAVAEQVRAGKVDEAGLKDKVDALVTAREDASPELRKAIEDLHGILDKDQRATFVDAIEARMKELAGGADAWLDSLAKDLDLSTAQKAAIRNVLDESRSELQEERKAAVADFEAFKGDDFSMEKISPIAQVGDKTRSRIDRMFHTAKEIVAFLSVEQMGKLADRIEARAGAKGSTGAQRPISSPSSEPDQVNPEQAGVEQVGPEQVGESEEPIIAARGGFRAGAVGGWGGGYASRSVAVGGGYAAGYPLVGGYGPGIW